MTTWGAESGHLRVGIDVSMSPATVTATTTEVTLTWTVSAQSVSYWFVENQTLTLSGAVAATKEYQKADPQKSGTYTTVIGSWTSTVPTSSSAPITKSLNATITETVTGGTPKVSVPFTVPQRPAAAGTGDLGEAPTSPATSSSWQVIADGAAVRTAAASSAVQVATLTTGSVLTGTVTGGWLRVDSGEFSGLYVNAQDVKLVAEVAPAPEPETPADPAPPVATLPPATDTGAERMDMIPAPGTMLWGSGEYDAFPQAAARDNVVLTVWRHARAHDVDRAATISCTISRDAGRTYDSPWTITIPAVTNAEMFPGGLAWDAKNRQWVMLVGWKQYADAVTKDVASRRVQVMTSKDDGRTWTTARDVPTTGATWFFVNDLAVDGDLWIAGGYGRLNDGVYSRCLTVTSTDAGQTWTPAVEVAGIPASSSWAEPNLVRVDGGWIMSMRSNDVDEIHAAVSLDGVSWAYSDKMLTGYTGNPDLNRLPDGTLVMLARTPNETTSAGGYSLGRWAWAFSLDRGKTWSVRTDFADQVRRNVYGSLAVTSEGAAIVYASEDDPDRPWASASVWYSRLVTQQLVVTQGFAGAVAAIDVSTADRIPVSRVWTDPWTGEEMVDQVRWRSLDGFTSRDFEVQQGQTVTYRAGSRVTGKVTAPILPSIMLIHPTHPDTLSIPIEVVSDGSRSYSLDAQTAEVPGSPYTIVTKSGGRKVRSPSGQTTFRTRCLTDAEKVLRLLEDGLPLFVSHHPGADFPDWIQPLEVERERDVQMCGHPDHSSPLGEWRTWSMKWVAVRRPSAQGMPIRRRIQDLTRPIQTLNLPIQEL